MPKRPRTSNTAPHQPGTEWPTPTKSKLQGAIEYADYLTQNSLPHTKQRAYDFFDIPTRTGKRLMAEDGAEDSEQEAGESGRRTAHTSKPQPRGAKPKIQPHHVRRMEEIINDGDIKHRALSWQELATKAGLVGDDSVHFHTVRALMHDLEYHKCIACTKNWLAPHIRAERRHFAQKYIHWKKQQWRKVRWTDEIHFGLGPQGKMRIIRRPGERYCFDCIQEQAEPEDDKDKKRLHAWAMVGYNYKSPLYWYTTNSSNGKMSHKKYVELLKEHVKPMLDRGEKFIMEEDRDSAHGMAENNNIVRRYKAEIGCDYYFNPTKSPDLSVIESVFQPLKQKLSNTGHWDEQSLKQRAEAIWNADKPISHDFINRQVDGMEDRMHEVLDGDGRMIGH